jgi:hypothetical protein
MSISSSARKSVGRFELGRWMVTRGASDELPGQCILDCFHKHARGDFGVVCAEDYEANLDAIAEGLRILSVYRCDNKRGDATKIYVITEADRSVTTLLLAEEY